MKIDPGLSDDSLDITRLDYNSRYKICPKIVIMI